MQPDNAHREANEPSVQSVERAVEILKCFLEEHELGLTDICSAVNLHKSTAFGIIATLKSNGFLEKNEGSGKYRLGSMVYLLAAHANLDLRYFAVPHVREICEETGETVELVIPDGTHITFIEAQESPHWLRIGSSVGKRLPMYCTAAGKAILAALPHDEASQILDRSELLPVTRDTRVSKSSLMKEFDAIRDKGYSVNVGELESGLAAVAAVICNRRGYPIGSISCSIPTMRIDDNRLEDIGLLLKKHCDEISVCMMQ